MLLGLLLPTVPDHVVLPGLGDDDHSHYFADTTIGTRTTDYTTTGTITGGAITISGDTFIIATTKTPTTANDTGTTGQIAWDSGYIYVCVATDTWERSALSSWGAVMLYENDDVMLYENGDTMEYDE